MRARSLVALLCLSALAPLPALAATVVIVNTDGAGEGFNDPTPRAPVAGNPGTTLGQQRLNVFQAAGNTWGKALKSTVQIKVESQFNDLFCDASRAVLGSAGPTTVERDFAGAPVASTWYVIAVANSILGIDDDPTDEDIFAQFNSRLDDGDPGCLGAMPWWYGIGAAVPAGQIDLYTTVLHEITHGLGFLSLHDPSTGAKFYGYDDAYLRLLYDETTLEGWSSMTNAERLASQVNTTNLTWTGANANAKVPGFNAGVKNGRLRMYAPNPYQSGSSVSHYDTALSPNELMEPILTSTSRDYAAYALAKDVGWRMLLIFKDSFESADDDFWSVSVP